MKTNFCLSWVLAALVTFGFNSCQKQQLVSEPTATEALAAAKGNPAMVNVFKGPVVQMGNGRARSWISIDHNDVPQEIGVEMTEGAMFGLPTDPLDFAAATFVLPLHQKAKALTAFDHIYLNWNVHGHEPEHVFDIPHFDFHFYMTTYEEQMAIPPYPLAPAAFDNLPPVAAWPPMYVPTPEGVPQMGKHWADVLFAPPFSKTMIYGSYNGRFTFVEPMVTRAFIMGGNTFSAPYSQLQQFPVANKYYPTKYNVYDDPATGSHYITLSHFVLR